MGGNGRKTGKKKRGNGLFFRSLNEICNEMICSHSFGLSCRLTSAGSREVLAKGVQGFSPGRVWGVPNFPSSPKRSLEKALVKEKRMSCHFGNAIFGKNNA